MHVGVSTTASALDENKELDIDTTISLETTWHAWKILFPWAWFVASAPGAIGLA